MPPTVLKVKDLKRQYNVQTVYSSFVYFNYFVHAQSMNEIIDKLKTAVGNALDNAFEHVNKQYRAYCALCGIGYKRLDYSPKVMTFEQLYELAKNRIESVDQLISQTIVELKAGKTDMRDISLGVVEKLCENVQLEKPVIIIFFAPPYCPHNTLRSDNPDQSKLYHKLELMIRGF